jgi:hypothetical protein
MDQDTPLNFPIERDPYALPEHHFTYDDGMSRASENGEKWKALGVENARRQLRARHCRQSHVA